MIRRKTKPLHEPTAIDGVITAIAPILIIGMIASLVFFLVIAFYRGQYDARLMYILGLFTVATVLIATIAIENGRAYANAFSIPLAIAAALAMFRFVTVSGPLGPFSPVINVGLLGVAWYLADRITFDCTCVDEREAGVQKGLLQSLRLIADAKPDHLSTTTPNAKGETKRRKRKHNPGVWVLYFALLALPLFGIGQLTIPDAAARMNAFKYLFIYLACTLGLLLTTSFIAMRRYVRHRGIEMPSELSRLWLGAGALGIAVILIACLILPLPSNRGPWLSSLPFDFVAPNGLTPSQWGWGNDGPTQSAQTAQQSPQSSSSAESQAADINGAQQQPPQQQPQNPDGSGAPQQPVQGSPQGSESAPKNSDATAGEAERQAANSESNASSSASEPQGSSNAEPSASPPDSSRSSASQPAQESRASEKPGESNSNKSGANAQSGSNASDPIKGGDQPPSDNAHAAENTPNEQQSSEQQSSQQPRSSASDWMNNLSFSGFSTLLKWIMILVLAAIVLFYVITHPQDIAAFWRGLQAFFANLFGRSTTSHADTPEASAEREAAESRKAFAAFADPFASTSTSLTPRQIVEHTFSALEAWAFEHGRARANAQTAEEFANQLARYQPQVGQHARSAAHMLDRVMFAGWKPTSRDIAPLAKLWQTLRQSSQT